ncbi:MAG TPA: alpha/beta hydrolase [Ensifer sp.]|nr:alpha/beta hydrolase [Ensifer sp.]
MTALLYQTPDNPLPPVHMEGTFRTHDGIDLRYAVFKGKTSPPKGTVVLLPGRSEPIEKYAETITDITNAGLWVATFDLRGQGGSPRLLKNKRLGHVRRFSDYQKDLDAFFEQIVLPDAKLPFFLVAHSTGGLIALASARRLANRVERIVVSAPFLGLASTRPSPRMVRFVAGLMCLIGLGGRASRKDADYSKFEGNAVTSDPVRFARNQAIFDAHPELTLGPPTWRWVHECLKAGRKVASPTYLQSITVPTLILGPTADRVASYPEIERMSRYFRAGKLIPINGSEHEVFQEAEKYRAQAMAALFAFIPGGFSEPVRLIEDEEKEETAG